MSLEFNKFFKRHNLASTYKPMLAKCLLDLGDFKKDEGSQWVEKKGNMFTVNLHFVAARFLRFYHPLKFKFKLKQEATKQSVAIYDKLETYKKLLGVKNTPSKKQICLDKFKKLREETIKHPLMRIQVLPKLQKDCNIYTISNDKNFIFVKEDDVKYMRENKDVLESALNHMISQYLENCNASPNISTKMDEELIRKYLSPKQKKEVLGIAENTCFYCPAKNKKFAMDHFIPWNYLGQTEQYNMVPACTPCNSSKHDKLTIPKYLDKLLERNKNLKKIPMGYSAEFLTNMYEQSIVEYYGEEKDLWQK
ncbi:MAG: HNH endonuclease [Candidatus Nitrosopelagicus sp.]|jgi:5-methylcytosine-specific restriction endonuclease McrA|nr:HNH endonuclease [Candidatus Nitrosopelagicus sp.]